MSEGNDSFSVRGSGRIWLDVGAHLGDASMTAAYNDPSLTVHAFEPLPALSRELRTGPVNYVVHAMAVAETDGTAVFYVNEFAAASSLLPMDEGARSRWIGGEVLREAGTVTVSTIRLDTFMTRLGIDDVEFMKVDTQGADLQVIRSAGAQLRRIERIKLEVQTTPNTLYVGSAPKTEVMMYMDQQGYDLKETELQTHGQEENLTFVRR